MNYCTKEQIARFKELWALHFPDLEVADAQWGVWFGRFDFQTMQSGLLELAKRSMRPSSEPMTSLHKLKFFSTVCGRLAGALNESTSATVLPTPADPAEQSVSWHTSNIDKLGQPLAVKDYPVEAANSYLDALRAFLVQNPEAFWKWLKSEKRVA